MAETRQEIRENKLKSLHSLSVSPVRFKNRTGRRVKLVWLDYNGKEQCKAELGLSQELNFNTYVTHPWIAKYVESKERILLNFRDVFFPPQPEIRRVEYRQRRAIAVRTVVLVTRPVHTLEEYCKQVIQALVSLENIKNLPLPAGILRDLNAVAEAK